MRKRGVPTAQLDNALESGARRRFADTDGERAATKPFPMLMRKTRFPLSLAAVAIAALMTFSSTRADEKTDRANALQVLQKGDYAAALATFKPLAEKGDPYAQFVLGQMAEQGLGIPQSYREAARWYKLAAGAGEPDAMTNLGYLYEQGKGVPQDYKEAVDLYRKAAEAGNAVAQTNLANVYFQGKLTAQNDKEAAAWYAEAARQGDPAAQFNLARMLDRGRGVEKDPKRALELYTESAKAGFPSAQLNLGVYYAEGHGVEKDAIEAHKWFNLAASSADDEDTQKNASRNRDLIAKQMTPDEIARAQALALEWKPSPPASGNAASALAATTKTPAQPSPGNGD
jgi:TPR repeat protein